MEHRGLIEFEPPFLACILKRMEHMHVQGLVLRGYLYPENFSALQAPAPLVLFASRQWIGVLVFIVSVLCTSSRMRSPRRRGGRPAESQSGRRRDTGTCTTTAPRRRSCLRFLSRRRRAFDVCGRGYARRLFVYRPVMQRAVRADADRSVDRDVARCRYIRSG